MTNDILLVISYGLLKEMIDNAQTDELNADGCVYSLHGDAEDNIEYELKEGTIKPLVDFLKEFKSTHNKREVEIT